jgi:predicted CXXCH cytochrome family protein
MAATSLVLIAATAVLLSWRHQPQSTTIATQQYADPASCIKCHAAETAGYAKTGMAHAFYKPTATSTIDAPAKDSHFYHAASGTTFSMTQHDGGYFQRRSQQGFDGKLENVEELPIDYIMGSGNHVRTYLHREQDGTLIELPLAWYAEDGGHWGMNPGYDNAHPMTRRPIAYECMFCHNAYPEIPSTAHRDLSANPVYSGALPQGIDCQRCHGPGAAHVQAAQTPGTSPQQIRAQILNPSRLSKDRQMEVCEQCHLETTSHSLPDRIRHYDREPFSYKAGAPLASFNSYFVRDPLRGRTDNFEIVNGPYRLRQSQCYLKSGGALTCESCHDPHDLQKSPASAAYYAKICMSCHSANLPAKIALHQHTASDDCVSCHMPKRRTEDVVHAIMTDHLIQRVAPPARELLAARQEVEETPANAYRGEVKRYLLDREVPGGDDVLYTAAAQVLDGSNSAAEIRKLAEAIRTRHPSQPNFSIELGDAMRRSGDLPGAIEAYRQALAVDPLSSRAQRRLGATLGGAGHADEALAVLEKALQREPDNALLWYEKAVIESRGGNYPQASADLRKCIALKPDFADAQNNLGSNLSQYGDPQGAEAAFRAALLINPYDSATRANLGRLLAAAGDWKQAAFHLQKAVQLDHANADAQADYALALLQTEQASAALSEAQSALRSQPKSPRLHDLLGQIFVQLRKQSQATTEFETALKLDPNFAPAQLDLSESLIQAGHMRDAVTLLQKAEHSSNPTIAERAHMLLQQVASH